MKSSKWGWVSTSYNNCHLHHIVGLSRMFRVAMFDLLLFIARIMSMAYYDLNLGWKIVSQDQNNYFISYAKNIV